MKILLAIIFLSLSSLLYAQQKNPLIEFTFYGGYASADLNWSIAGNFAGQSPDVLSEVKWKALSGPLAKTQLKINFTQRWFLSSEFARCFVKSGTVTDADYATDGRGGQTYYAALRSDEGNLNDFSVLAGYYFLKRKNLKVAILGGYRGSRENLFLLDNNKVAAGERSLYSSYQSSWKGPSIALSASYMIISRIMLQPTFTYTQLKYNATANWNLIDAFKHPVSFTHYAKGFNFETSLICSYLLSNRFSLLLAGTYNDAQTGTGVDRLFLESGSIQTTQFNGAQKAKKSLSLGFSFAF